jgi:hypothetical protein
MDQHIEVHITQKLPNGYYLVSPKIKDIPPNILEVKIECNRIHVDLTKVNFIPLLIVEVPLFEDLFILLGPQHKIVPIIFEFVFVTHIRRLVLTDDSEVELRLYHAKELYISEMSGRFSKIYSSNPNQLIIGCLITKMDEEQNIQSVFERCTNVWLYLDNNGSFRQYLFLEHLPSSMRIFTYSDEVHILSTNHYSVVPDSTSIINLRSFSYTKVLRRNMKGHLIVDLVKMQRTKVEKGFIIGPEVNQGDILKIQQAHSFVKSLRENGNLPDLILITDNKERFEYELEEQQKVRKRGHEECDYENNEKEEKKMRFEQVDEMLFEVYETFDREDPEEKIERTNEPKMFNPESNNESNGQSSNQGSFVVNNTNTNARSTDFDDNMDI